MTIDERLERLVERHEALAPTVELNQHQIEANTQAIARLTEAQMRAAEMQVKNEIMLAELSEDVRTLAAISKLHNNRIDRLEKK